MLVSEIEFQDMGDFDPAKVSQVPSHPEKDVEAELSDQEFERNRQERIDRERGVASEPSRVHRD